MGKKQFSLLLAIKISTIFEKKTPHGEIMTNITFPKSLVLIALLCSIRSKTMGEGTTEIDEEVIAELCEATTLLVTKQPTNMLLAYSPAEDNAEHRATLKSIISYMPPIQTNKEKRFCLSYILHSSCSEESVATIQELLEKETGDCKVEIAKDYTCLSSSLEPSTQLKPVLIKILQDHTIIHQCSGIKDI